MSKNDLDLFGDSSSSSEVSSTDSFFQTSSSGDNPVKGFNSASTQKKKKIKKAKPPMATWKKVLLVAIALGILVGGSYSYKVYRENQLRIKAVELKNRNHRLSKVLTKEVRKFNTNTHSVKSARSVSPWDINLSYVSNSEELSDFASAIASQVSLRVSGDSVEVKYLNWDYVSFYLKNVSPQKIMELTASLKPSAYNYKEELLSVFASYLSGELKHGNSEESSLIKGIETNGDVKVPPIWRSATISSALDKNGNFKREALESIDSHIFSSKEFHEALDTFSTLASGGFGKALETEEHKKWASDNADVIKKASEVFKRLSISDLSRVDLSVVTSMEDREALSAYKQALASQPPFGYQLEKPTSEIVKVLPYNFIGSTYIESKKSDKVSEGDLETTGVRIGDGSYDSPYTFGTPFKTKALGTDGKYHDVRVTLLKIVTGEKAIEGVQGYDERNTGFTSSSSLDLGYVTFRVDNLEDKEIEVNSEISLADKDLVLEPRTGNMYSFKERAKIKAGSSVEMSDWFYAQGIDTSNLIWGKSFNRKHTAVFLNALGDEVYDKYGRKMDRKTRKVVENKSQSDLDAVKRLAQEDSYE